MQHKKKEIDDSERIKKKNKMKNSCVREWERMNDEGWREYETKNKQIENEDEYERMSIWKFFEAFSFGDPRIFLITFRWLRHHVEDSLAFKCNRVPENWLISAPRLADPNKIPARGWSFSAMWGV